MFLKLKREIEEKEAKINEVSHELEKVKDECEEQTKALSEFEEKIAELKIQKEKFEAENNKLNEEARTSQHRLFELQAKVIDSEVEIARLKKEQVGPIVKRR